jgi:predicted metal-dependent enzyme (double-stranded beta helix superfamily)
VSNLSTVIAPLRTIDWEDMNEVESVGRKVLEEINSTRSVLRLALDELPSQADLLSLCEHPDAHATSDLGQQLDKIVLYSDSDSGVRVRLHAFWPGYYDLPHNHRWSFVSLVLRGAFTQTLFGRMKAGTDASDASLNAVAVREEKAGAIYALHHEDLHALISRRPVDTIGITAQSTRPQERSRINVCSRRC